MSTEKITDSVIGNGMKMLNELVHSYQRQINKAYLDQEELAVNLKLKFSPFKDGVKIGYALDFVESKVKDGDHIVMNEAQLNLPFDGLLGAMEPGDSIEVTGPTGRIFKAVKK